VGHGKNKTYLICYDDFRWFTEDVKSHFDIDQYNIVSFLNEEEFMNYLEKDQNPGYCRIAILGAHDTSEHFTMIGSLAREIKASSPSTGIILIGTHDKMEEIKKVITSGIDSYIPKNANMNLRLQNAVKKLESEYAIIQYGRKRKQAFYSLVGIGIVIILLTALALLKLPQIF
jgi:DNA-binding NarL/FixJ family response regulator